MVQPYVPSVDADGETALLWLGGAFSHAIRKGHFLRRGAKLVEGLFAQEDISARTPAPRNWRSPSGCSGPCPVGRTGCCTRGSTWSPGRTDRWCSNWS